MFSSAIQRLNDRRNATGDAGADAGFTLIELMVVLLILAILLAIAIPTFLGVTKSANDRAAQSNLNTALLNAKAQYQQNSQAYPATAALVTALTSAEPSLTFQAGASTDQNHISVFVTADSSALVMTAYSKPTQNCWIVVDTPTSTAVAAPFAAAQAPTVAVDTTLAPVAATTNVAFLNTTLGPTYAEMKTTSTGTVTSGSCLASQPSAILNTSYRWSRTAFPSI
jgi:type IV pilus assembly protein PilA